MESITREIVDNKIYRLAFILLVLTRMLDFITTFISVEYLGAYEANPLPALIIPFGWEYVILGQLTAVLGSVFCFFVVAYTSKLTRLQPYPMIYAVLILSLSTFPVLWNTFILAGR
jgi:hypothetical protein